MKAFKSIFIVFFLLLPAISIAQEVTPTPIEENTANKNKPITIDTFVSELEKLSAAQEKFSELVKNHNFEAFENKYLNISQDLERKAKIAKKEVSQKIAFSTDDLNKIEQPLVDLKNQIENNNKEVKKIGENFSSHASQFQILEERWQTAYENFQARADSKAIIEEVRQGLDVIKKSKLEAETQLNKLILLQAKYNEGLAKIREFRELLSEARIEFKQALFTKEDNSMFSKIYWNNVINFDYKLIYSLLGAQLNGTEAYLKQNSNRIYLLFGLIIFTSLLVRTIRKSTFAEASFKSLYDNPTLLTIVTSLIITHFVFYDSDSNFHIILNLLLVFPVILFLKDILGDRYSSIISGIGLLFVIGQIRVIIRSFTVCDKLALLIQLLLAVYFSKEFTKTCKTAETDNVQAKDPNVIDDNKEVIKENNKTLVILGQFGKLFQVIFSFAAFFLLLGFYRLVLFFEDTLFNALYLGLILFVVYKLCFGFGVFFIQIPYAQHIRVIKKNTEKLIQLFNRLLIFCAVVFWLYRGMFALGIDKSVINGIKSFLASGIEIGDLNIQVGGIILAVFFLLAGGKISLGIRAILEEEFYARKQLDPGTRNTLDTGIHYVVLILSVLAAVGSLGIGLQNIAIIAGALSVGIGFGLQNIVNNFVSGIILLFERPIKVGDLILVGDNVGTVSRIGIRSSTIKTLDEAEIIIPNATLVTDKVVNWTLTNKRARMVVSVGVAYGTDLEKCSKVLLDTLKAQEFILDYPQPDVLFKSFGDSSLNFEARGWIRNVLERPDLHSRLSIAIHNAIRDAGITIPFPQRDVHIIKPAEQI